MRLLAAPFIALAAGHAFADAEPPRLEPIRQFEVKRLGPDPFDGCLERWVHACASSAAVPIGVAEECMGRVEAVRLALVHQVERDGMDGPVADLANVANEAAANVRRAVDAGNPCPMEGK